MRKVIVTGGLGYIGSHTVVELVNNGYEPIIVDNLSNSEIEILDGIQEITGRTIVFENVDLAEEPATIDLFKKHKDAIGVIHFAALKAVGESVKMPTEYYRNNIFGLVNILTAIKKVSIANLIFSSSCTVYGQPAKLPVTESTPFKPAESPYGSTKQIGEEILKAAAGAEENLNAISLRYFNPIGAHDSALIGELPKGVPNNLVPYITQTAAGLRQSLSVYGGDYSTSDGTAIRDYIHVVDLAEAHVVALKRLADGKNETSFEFFNLGTGKGYSVLEVIKSFEKSTGEKLNYSIVERRAGDIESIYADTTKATEVLGWNTKRTLDQMMLSAWNWEKQLRNIS